MVTPVSVAGATARAFGVLCGAAVETTDLVVLTDFPDCVSRLLGLSTGFDAATGFFVAGVGFGGGADLTGADFAAVLTGLLAGFIATFGGVFFAGTTARVGFAAALTGAFFAFAATGLV